MVFWTSHSCTPLRCPGPVYSFIYEVFASIRRRNARSYCLQSIFIPSETFSWNQICFSMRESPPFYSSTSFSCRRGGAVAPSCPPHTEIKTFKINVSGRFVCDLFWEEWTRNCISNTSATQRRRKAGLVKKNYFQITRERFQSICVCNICCTPFSLSHCFLPGIRIWIFISSPFSIHGLTFYPARVHSQNIMTEAKKSSCYRDFTKLRVNSFNYIGHARMYIKCVPYI